MWYDFIMRILFFGGYVFCGETIIPKGTRGSQLSFKFTIRLKHIGEKNMKDYKIAVAGTG